jgi:hypothetical protein
LQPVMIKDPKLGQKIKPNSGGHDAWGFRNKTIPDKFDIIIIGDSQTYGVSAIAKLSYPSQLNNMTEDTVYNMGIGGYGAYQYKYLLKEKALKLNPKTVIVGFYFGNDLYDTNEYYERIIIKKPINNLIKNKKTFQTFCVIIKVLVSS